MHDPNDPKSDQSPEAIHAFTLQRIQEYRELKAKRRQQDLERKEKVRESRRPR